MVDVAAGGQGPAVPVVLVLLGAVHQSVVAVVDGQATRTGSERQLEAVVEAIAVRRDDVMNHDGVLRLGRFRCTRLG